MAAQGELILLRQEIEGKYELAPFSFFSLPNMQCNHDKVDFVLNLSSKEYPA